MNTQTMSPPARSTEQAQALVAKLAHSPAFLLAIQEAIEEQAPSHADALDLARKIFPQAQSLQVRGEALDIVIACGTDDEYRQAVELALDHQGDFDRFGLTLLPLPR